MNTLERVLMWLMGLAILGLVLWAAFIKPTDKNNYQPDSKPVSNTITRWPFTIDLNFGCTRDSLDSIKNSTPKK